MIKYTLAMSIRVVCLVLMLFVQGWWLVVCVAGAIILPYIAVVLANVGSKYTIAQVERPGAIVPLPQPAPRPQPDQAGPTADGQRSDNGARPDEDKRSA